MRAPLIVTLEVDEDTQQFFDRQRRANFPAARNQLRAHVTLFHALPGARERAVRAVLRELVDRPGFPVEVAAVRQLGKGVAYDLAAPEVGRIRDEVAARFRADLTPQDAQRLKPHVTVANKMPPTEAKELFRELSAQFTPFSTRATALTLHRYLGGPWERIESFPFSDAIGSGSRVPGDPDGGATTGEEAVG